MRVATPDISPRAITRQVRKSHGYAIRGTIPILLRPSLAVQTVEFSGYKAAATIVLIGKYLTIEILLGASAETTTKIYRSRSEATDAFCAAKNYIAALGMEEV